MTSSVVTLAERTQLSAALAPSAPELLAGLIVIAIELGVIVGFGLFVRGGFRRIRTQLPPSPGFWTWVGLALWALAVLVVALFLGTILFSSLSTLLDW